jgi:hypothetical protein
MKKTLVAAVLSLMLAGPIISFSKNKNNDESHHYTQLISRMDGYEFSLSSYCTPLKEAQKRSEKDKIKLGKVLTKGARDQFLIVYGQGYGGALDKYIDQFIRTENIGAMKSSGGVEFLCGFASLHDSYVRKIQALSN